MRPRNFPGNKTARRKQALELRNNDIEEYERKLEKTTDKDRKAKYKRKLKIAKEEKKTLEDRI